MQEYNILSQLFTLHPHTKMNKLMKLNEWLWEIIYDNEKSTTFSWKIISVTRKMK